MPTKYHFTLNPNRISPVLNEAIIDWETQEPNLEEVYHNTTIRFVAPHIVNLYPTEKTPALPKRLLVHKIFIMNYTDRSPGPAFKGEFRKAGREGYTEYWVQVYHNGGAEIMNQLYGHEPFERSIAHLLRLPLTFDEFDSHEPGMTQLVLSLNHEYFPLPKMEYGP